MLKKIMAPVLATMMAFTAVAASYEPAEAGNRHRGRGVAVGVAAGIIGLGILGAAANAGRHRSDVEYDDYDDRECYRGPEQCGWTNRRCFENSWGERVCRGGRWTCWRDTVCE